MSGRENFEDQFDQVWHDAFEGADVTPPPVVWNEIDRRLAYKELSVYKSKAMYYRSAVAAIILLAASFGTWQYLYFQNKTEQLATSAITIDHPEPMNGMSLINSYVALGKNTTGSVNTNSINTNDQSIINKTKGSKVDNSSGSGSTSVTNGLSYFESSSSVAPIDNDEDKANFHELWNLDSKSISTETILAVTFRELKKIPVYKFEQLENDKRVAHKEKYFAGVSFGSGGFDPNYESTGGSLLASNLDVNPSAFSLSDNEAIYNQSPSVREGMLPGESVSLGVNLGMKLSNRWTLESGLQYARTDATTQTNLVIQTSTWQESIPATSQVRGNKQFESAVKREEVVEYDYRDLNLRNEFQFASVPLKAGFLVLDKKLKLELNAGLIANIYMGNRLSGHEDEIAQLTIGPGDQSPYRELSFSGLAGIELGYRLLKRFDVVLEPNYRRSINSLTKDDATFLTNPSGFGVVTGIRYNFN